MRRFDRFDELAGATLKASEADRLVTEALTRQSRRVGQVRSASAVNDHPRKNVHSATPSRQGLETPGSDVRQTGAMAQMLIPSSTDRLQFRRYESRDVDAVIEMFADEEAKRWYPMDFPPDEAERWIQWVLGNYEQDGVGLWVIEDRSTGNLLGDCGLTYQEVEDEHLLEIGYHLQHQHRGRGYALEGARACRDFALRILKVPSVCSQVDPRNTSSIRVAESIHDSFRTFVNSEGDEWNLYWTDSGSTRDGV